MPAAITAIYHNCGNAMMMMDSIAATGAAAFHFSNGVDMEEMLRKMPKDKPVMGNVDPAGHFRNGSPEFKRNTFNVCVGTPVSPFFN